MTTSTATKPSHPHHLPQQPSTVVVHEMDMKTTKPKHRAPRDLPDHLEHYARTAGQTLYRTALILNTALRIYALLRHGTTN